MGSPHLPYCSSRPSRARRPPGPSPAPSAQGLHSSPPWRAFPEMGCRYANPQRLTGTASALQCPEPEASKMDVHALPALQRPSRPCLVSTVYGSSIKSRMTLIWLRSRRQAPIIARRVRESCASNAPHREILCSSRPSRARRPPGPSPAPSAQGLHSSPPWRAFPEMGCRYANPQRLTGTASALQCPEPEASKMDVHALPALQRPSRPCLVSTVYGSSIKSRMTLIWLRSRRQARIIARRARESCASSAPRREIPRSGQGQALRLRWSLQMISREGHAAIPPPCPTHTPQQKSAPKVHGGCFRMRTAVMHPVCIFYVRTRCVTFSVQSKYMASNRSQQHHRITQLTAVSHD